MDHIAIDVTDEQRANLRTLARGLMAFDRAVKFDMVLYCAGDNGRYVHASEANECGTTACAAGHGPMLGIEPLPYEGWGDYAERSFGAITSSRIWDMVFSAAWARHDNTREGAARRIAYMLDFGVPVVGYGQILSFGDLIRLYRDHDPDWLHPEPASPESLAVARALQFV